MYCPNCKGSGLLQWPNFTAYERRGMGYSSPTRLNQVHNPLREGTPCPTCHGTGHIENDDSSYSVQGGHSYSFSSDQTISSEERAKELRHYKERLDEINIEISEQKQVISSWTGSKNKLKKQKKKLRHLELVCTILRIRIEELKY